MSELEEFEKWAESNKGSYIDANGAWQACAKLKNKVIEQQAAEIEALREFAKSIIDYLEQDPDYVIELLAVKFGLLEKITVFEPCPYEPCGCKEYCDKDEFREGVECLKRTLLLNPNLAALRGSSALLCE